MVEEIIDGDVEFLVEAVYWRYGSLLRRKCNTKEEAVNGLCAGEEYGECSAVGVFVNGELVLTGTFLWDDDDYNCTSIQPPTVEEIDFASEYYRAARTE